jgi:DNA-binding CsgD family transcriptional regulator
LLNDAEFRLTAVDREIIELLVNHSFSVADIASHMKRRPATIKGHLYRIYARAGLKGVHSAKRIMLAKMLRPAALEPQPTRCELTLHQWTLARMTADGLSNVDIAKVIGKSRQTVKNELKHVFDLTGMSTRLELADWYERHGRHLENAAVRAACTPHPQRATSTMESAVSG